MTPSEAHTKRQLAERKGHWAERRAEISYQLRGFSVLARRYRTPTGELDLVLRRGSLIAFVEVKARPTTAEAIEAVDFRLRRRIEAAGKVFLTREQRRIGHPQDQLSIRYDIVAVGASGMFGVTRVIDAWREGE